jgi:hypothetical protein
MDIPTLLLSASELFDAVTIPTAECTTCSPSAKAFAVKFRIAASLTERLQKENPAVLVNATNADIAERLFQFVETIQVNKPLLIKYVAANNEVQDTEVCAMLQSSYSLIDGVIDILEGIELACATVHIDQQAERLPGEFDRNFEFHPESSAYLERVTKSIIGQGSFGFTHRMSFDGRLLAVKRVDEQRLGLAGVSSERLKNECAVLRGLAHPNIVRYFSHFYSGGREKFNIVSELVEGPSLADRVGSAPPLTVTQISEWTKQIASALTYMHGKGVLHRDLRLDNVMLSVRSRIKLCDISPSCAAHYFAAFGRHATELDVYSSYEKTHRRPYDGRDDVYATGIILLSLLLGHRYAVGRGMK